MCTTGGKFNTFRQRFPCTYNGTQKLIRKTTNVPKMIHVALLVHAPKNDVALNLIKMYLFIHNSIVWFM